MLLKGTVYVTYDINLCLSNLNMCKTIVIADEPDQYNIPGKIGGSILLPPYEAMVCLVDNNIDGFRTEYLSYLRTDYSVDRFMSIIIQALILGTNIIFLMDPQGPEFEMVLKEFFMTQYGILLGDSNTPFSFDISYTPFILNKLYAEDNIPKEMYLNLYPQESTFDQFTLQKLMYEYAINSDLVGANNYFKKQSLILKNGGIIRGVVKRHE